MVDLEIIPRAFGEWAMFILCYFTRLYYFHPFLQHYDLMEENEKRVMSRRKI
jgi:hypothetical protein